MIPTRAPALEPGVEGVTAHDVPVSDGDALRVVHRRGATDTLVTAFHGLSGDADVDYMRLTAEAARDLGHGVVLVNHRGCGDGRGLAKGIYHSGRADDVAAVIGWARDELGYRRHIAVGISLSGNALLLLAGKRMTPTPDAIVAVNPPVDLRSCAERIRRGFNQVYDKRFVQRCTAMLVERRDDGLLPREFDIPTVRSLREFDDVFTAPLAGFADAEDYYARCSAQSWLHAIDTPSVIVTSRDDPFVAADDVMQAERSDAVQLHLEAHGGHAGYLAAAGFGRTDRWLRGALRHYVAELAGGTAPR